MRASGHIQVLVLTTLMATMWSGPAARGQAVPQGSFGGARQTQSSTDTQAESELQKGIALTRQGRFQDAIAHLQAAQGRVADEYAASFNLALCYVATSEYQSALPILRELQKNPHAKPEVYSLLSQALIGSDQPDAAFESFQKAVAMDPQSEKLYLFVADACMDSRNYDLGLKVLEVGLQHLPKSPRLHYEKGIFYSFLNEPDKSEDELEEVSKIAPGSVIASLAEAQKGLLDGDTSETIRAAREGIRKDPGNYILLSILGQALIRNGVAPGQPEFDEARSALEKSVAARPDYWVSQQALGQIYLMMGRVEDAIAHLEIARQLSPATASVYSYLAKAYRLHGDPANAQKMLSALANLNQQQAAKYKLAPPDHMASYMGSREQ